MKTSSDQRNSSIELLRILAILFIIISHCSVHSDLEWGKSTILFNNLFADWCVLGNLGVDIFVIISGYFLSASRNPQKSMLSLWTQVTFYSLFSAGLYLITGHQIGLLGIIQTLFPTISGSYWFFTAYIVMLLLSPYINLLLESMTRLQMLKLLGSMLLLWCVIPTFTSFHMFGNEISEFFMFYVIGAYIHKYPDNVFAEKKIRRTVTCISFVLMFLSSVILFFVIGNKTTFFYTRSSILTVGCAVGLFTTALYHERFYNRLINKIASCTFGIYLLHDNVLIRKVLWTEWLPKRQYQNSLILVLAVIISVVLVMLVGVLIELVRKKLIADRMTSAITMIKNQLEVKINQWQSYFRFQV